MKYTRRQTWMSALGLVACCVVIAAIVLVGVRLKLTRADPYLAGRDYLQAIHDTYHTKGAYTSDPLTSITFKSGNNGVRSRAISRTGTCICSCRRRSASVPCVPASRRRGRCA